MARYHYRARNTAGQTVEGEQQGGSPGQVAALLNEQGLTPIRIEPLDDKAGGGSAAARRKGMRGGAPTLDDLELFARQMYSLSSAGVPVIRGLRGLADTTTRRAMAEAMTEIADALETGQDLSSAMAAHPKIFPPLFINMVRVGEHTGRLDEAFGQLAQYTEREKETRQRVQSALRYPSFVLVAITAAIAIINLFVIPAFADIFSRLGEDLPLATRILIGLSDFMVNYWQVMLGGLAVLALGIRYGVNTEGGRFAWDRTKLRLPVVGPIILKATLSRFARAYTMTARAGVPVLEAMNSVSRALDNAFVGDRVRSMRDRLERGEAMVTAAHSAGLFTPLVLQMIAVGEETGRVQELMEEVANFYEREVDYALKNLSSSIEPILISFIGIIVLILALGVFLPMWELGAAAM